MSEKEKEPLPLVLMESASFAIVSMAWNGSNSSTESPTDFIFTTSKEQNRIKFSFLFILHLCSFTCYLYLFYQFYRKRQLRGAHYHHVIILLLIASFLFIIISLPLTEAYLFTSYVHPASATFCSFWLWLHYSLNIINLYLMAFACIERNWLIFNPKFVISKCRVLLLHYIPLTICIVLPPSFYFTAIFIYRCEQHYNYTQLLCKWPCYFYSEIWTNIDLYMNNYIPLFSIPVSCLCLLYTSPSPRD